MIGEDRSESITLVNEVLSTPGGTLTTVS